MQYRAPGTRLIFCPPFALSSKIPQTSTRSGSWKSVFKYEVNSRAHPRCVLGLLVFCFSVGVGKRSSVTLPPVGGAQQSQVAVGGTAALLRRRRRRLGGSQHLCVLKQVGKRRLRSSRSVFHCDSGSRRFSAARTPRVITRPKFFVSKGARECVSSHISED